MGKVRRNGNIRRSGGKGHCRNFFGRNGGGNPFMRASGGKGIVHGNACGFKQLRWLGWGLVGGGGMRLRDSAFFCYSYSSVF